MLRALLLAVAFLGQSAEAIREFHPDGSPKSVCEARREPGGTLVRHGQCTLWHANGKVAAEGSFADGLETGEWELRYESGRKQATGSFERGLRAGTWKLFRDGGGIELEGAYVDGRRDGEWKRFDERQQVVATVFYRYSHGDDPARGWRWEGETVDGSEQGPWRCVRRDGSLVFAGEYERGAPHGPWAHFHADGSFDDRWSSAVYQHGERVEPLAELPEALRSAVTPPEPDLARLPPIDVAPAAAELLERALAGDESARAELLRDPRNAYAAALARLVRVDLRRADDAAFARRLNDEFLGAILGAAPPWTESTEENTHTILCWHSLWEYAADEPSIWRGDLCPSRHWIAPELASTLWGRPPTPGAYMHDVELEPSAPPLGVIGIGGGSGPRYGGRFGGKRNLKARGGKDTETPLASALAWIARTQEADGAWSPQRFEGDAELTTVVTAECALALLGDGNTPSHGEYPDAVERALRWLVLSQDPATGRVGRFDAEAIYEHALAADAIAEGAFFTQWPALREATRRAARFLEGAQLADGSWPLAHGGTAGDPAATGAALLALLTADLCGSVSDRGRFARALRWFEARTGTNGEVMGAPSNARRRAAPSTGAHATATSISCAILAGESPETNATLARQVKYFELLAPRTPELAGAMDADTRCACAYAAFQLGGTKLWDPWNRAVKPSVLAKQVQAGDAAGSWPAAGSPGGRLHSTAVRALTLEVYFRLAKALAW